MHIIILLFLSFLPYIATDNSTILQSKHPWLRLPATPQLPSPMLGQHVNIDGAVIWYTIYGPKDAAPLLFIHGGLANSDYWGLQVQKLQSLYRCILMDSRGHGRSTKTSANITYDLMTSDVVALLNHLSIERTHIVGWSDGAIIGLNLAMKYPSRVSSLFAFAANYVPSGVKDVFASSVWVAFRKRTEVEYEALSPMKNYSNLYNNLISMWNTLPHWTQQDFARINPNLPVWIVDADHEESIFREQPDTMTQWISQAGELILPRTSHFAFLQDPEMFTASLTRFLSDKFSTIETFDH